VSKKPSRTARFIAIETLCQLEKNRLPVNLLFDRLVSRYEISENDRQLATNIIFGVLRRRQSLDLILKPLCTRPLNKLKPFVHQALAVALYQLFFLDRIPESAAVNESVKALQAAHLPKQLQGFVNGVLRNGVRRREELQQLLDDAGETVLNHPLWLTDRWRKRFGPPEAIRICHHNNEQPPLTLQVNRLRCSRNTLLRLLTEAGISAEEGKYGEDAIILKEGHGSPATLPGFHEGFFQVQDQGAQLLPLLLGPLVPGGSYLDGCAGVGGKTSVLIQHGQPIQTMIVGVEPEEERQHRFRENMRRLHPDLEVSLSGTTLQDYVAMSNTLFHGILLDAPCSGTGVIGRHPDIRWNRRIEDLAVYQQTQFTLLQAAARRLHPDGTMVYASCSLEPEENEEVIERFLVAHPAFTLEDCSEYLPPAARHFVKNGCFAPLPGPDIDGFFGARLVKRM